MYLNNLSKAPERDFLAIGAETEHVYVLRLGSAESRKQEEGRTWNSAESESKSGKQTYYIH